jgi:sugar phosphate isomerase/epimerase
MPNAMLKNLSRTLLALVLWCLTHGGHAVAHPFFAMDTAIGSPDLIPVAADLGFAGVGWRPEPAERLTAILKQVRERNLSLFAIYTGATLENGVLRWPRLVEEDLPVLAGSNAVIWLTVGAQGFAPSDATPDAEVVEGLRKMAERAAGHGVRIALYPHKGSWVERIQDATRLAKKVDHPALGVTFNLCHCLMLGDEDKIPELLGDAGKHLFLVTVNGADRNAPHTSWKRLIRPLDEGDFDLAGLLNLLSEKGYQGPVGLQGFGISCPPAENLSRSMGVWRRLQKDPR